MGLPGNFTKMNPPGTGGNSALNHEVSESAFEYLLTELIFYVKSTTADPEKISQTLEHMGYEIGFRYIEKIAPQMRFLGSEPLDYVKFVCKEFWEELFHKKVTFPTLSMSDLNDSC